MSDSPRNAPGIVANPWASLRQLTRARIALGRAGVSVPTSAQLAFQLAHAQARDAVHAALDTEALAASLGKAGYDCRQARSACPDRAAYLQRPDLGRCLDDASRAMLAGTAPPACDLALVVADGLSALAIAQNAAPFLAALRPRLQQDHFSLAPLVIVQQGRVAIGDDIGAVMHARAVVVLIGERPGLSSPDSMGLYLTWAPRVGLTDAFRNCIFNVRPAGLGYPQAAQKLHFLLSEARRRSLSGVALKDDTMPNGNSLTEPAGNFLLP